MKEKQAAECIYTMAASTGYTPREVMNAVVLLTPHMQAAWEIVKALAESDPYAYSDNTGLMECVFCNDSYGWPPFDKVTQDHEPDCLISKAQTLVKEQTS